MEDSWNWVVNNFDSLSDKNQNRAIKAALTYGLAPFIGGHLFTTQVIKRVTMQINHKFAIRIFLPISVGMIASQLFFGSIKAELNEIYKAHHNLS